MLLIHRAIPWRCLSLFLNIEVELRSYEYKFRTVIHHTFLYALREVTDSTLAEILSLETLLIFHIASTCNTPDQIFQLLRISFSKIDPCHTAQKNG